MLTKDEKILETGLYENLSKLADEQINLQGGTMSPGFVNSHLYMIAQGENFE